MRAKIIWRHSQLMTVFCLCKRRALGHGVVAFGTHSRLFPFFWVFFFIFRSSNVQTDFKKKMIRKLKLLNTEYYNAIKIFIQIQKFGYRLIHFILKAFKVIHHHDIMTERICRKMTLVGHNHHTYLLMLTIWFSIWFDRNLTVFVYIYSWLLGKLAKYLIWVE